MIHKLSTYTSRTLLVLPTAQFYSPTRILIIDLDHNRLKESKRFGAIHTAPEVDNILEAYETF